MADKRKFNGSKKGENRGQGRKPKIEEEKQHRIFSDAIKRITGIDEDDESKVMFLVSFAEGSDVGKKFIAEHTFGKPKEVIKSEVVIKGVKKDYSSLSKEELKQLAILDKKINEH